MPEIMLRNYDSIAIFLLTFFKYIFLFRAKAYDGQAVQNEIFTFCYICHNCRVSDCLINRQSRPDKSEFRAGSSLFTRFSTGSGDN